ncbi:MAG: hypothetical protein KVP17_004641, partial [Porospora cf. gigantea B]
MRRAQSFTGDFSVLDLPYGEAYQRYGQTSPGFDKPGFEAEVMEAADSLLPHRMRWVRNIDANFGFKTLEQRLVKGHCIFANGARYDGHLHDGIPHGKGVYHCDVCPLTYSGNFSAGNPSGYGVMECGKGRDKFLYYGEFKNGQRSGRGTFLGDKHSDDYKLYMAGVWSNDMLGSKPGDGDRPFSQTIVDVHPGVKNEESDFHDERYRFRRYIGDVCNGRPDGKGRYEWFDGCHYKGGFKDGVRDGPGDMFDEIKKLVVKSEWEKDTPTGRIGRLQLPNGGMYYSGEVLQGERNGLGEVYYNGGTLAYEGYFVKDQACGRGWARNKHTGDVYVGEFRNSSREGKGTYIFSTGERLVGDFKNDQPHGKIMLYKDEHDNNPIALLYNDGELDS